MLSSVTGSSDPVDIGMEYDTNDAPHSFTLLRSSHQYELWYTITDADSIQLQSSALVQVSCSYLPLYK